jgi:hypothetical protein
MDEDMETWTRTWKFGRRNGNMDEDMETWTRPWKQDETWRQGRGHGDMEM